MPRDTVVIHRPPEEVWEIVGDPRWTPAWNPKISDVVGDGTLGVDFRYRCRARLREGGPARAMRCEVETHRPPAEIVVRCTMDGARAGRFVRERYVLEPVPGGTRVTQEIDLRHAGIPWPWRLLMSLLSRFGRPTGTPYLQRLRSLVETGVAENARGG